MKNFVSKVVESFKFWRRKRDIVSKCGCVSFCPFCGDPLNDQATWLDPNWDGHGRYRCNKCGKISEWHFSAAPVPICTTVKG